MILWHSKLSMSLYAAQCMNSAFCTALSVVYIYLSTLVSELKQPINTLGYKFNGSHFACNIFNFIILMKPFLFYIRHESEGWGFESPSGRDIFCLKNVDTFPKTPVPVPKMNAAAHAQLTFQMLTLLQKYLYRQSQYSTTWDSKCLALIAQ